MEYLLYLSLFSCNSAHLNIGTMNALCRVEYLLYLMQRWSAENSVLVKLITCGKWKISSSLFLFILTVPKCWNALLCSAADSVQPSSALLYTCADRVDLSLSLLYSAADGVQSSKAPFLC